MGLTYKQLRAMMESKILEQEEEEKNRIKEELDEKEKQDACNNHFYNILNSRNKQKAANESYLKFKDNVYNFLLEEYLFTILDKSVIKTAVSENLENFCRGIVHNYVLENGYDNILQKFNIQNTLVLSEAETLIDKYSNRILSEADKNDCETHKIDEDDVKEYYKDIDNESMENISDMIRSRVSQATEEFINRNIVDDMNTEDILKDTKEKIDNIRGMNDNEEQELKEYYNIQLKKRLNRVVNRNRNIYEQIVYNISESTYKNEALLEQYTDSTGKLNMDKITARSTCIYTFLEMLNTLKIEEFNRDNILDFIKVK